MANIEEGILTNISIDDDSNQVSWTIRWADDDRDMHYRTNHDGEGLWHENFDGWFQTRGTMQFHLGGSMKQIAKTICFTFKVRNGIEA